MGFINDVLLIPMFTIVLLEISTSMLSKEARFFGISNLAFCATFGFEWALGIAIAEDRKRYLLSPGKLADLVVLASDFLTCPVDDIRDMQVDLTMVGGRTVFRRCHSELDGNGHPHQP